jgi:hypothetical protein
MRTCGRCREPSRRVRDASLESYRAPARSRAIQSAHKSVKDLASHGLDDEAKGESVRAHIPWLVEGPCALTGGLSAITESATTNRVT